MKKATHKSSVTGARPSRNSWKTEKPLAADVCSCFRPAMNSLTEASALLSLVHTTLAHGIPPMIVRRLIGTGVVIADDSYRVFIPEV